MSFLRVSVTYSTAFHVTRHKTKGGAPIYIWSKRLLTILLMGKHTCLKDSSRYTFHYHNRTFLGQPRPPTKSGRQWWLSYQYYGKGQHYGQYFISGTKLYSNFSYLLGFSPLLMAFKVKAEDRRQRIMTKMAATVRITPPMTAARIVIEGRLSEESKVFYS